MKKERKKSLAGVSGEEMEKINVFLLEAQDGNKFMHEASKVPAIADDYNMN
jgi:hypothetical protein